jgi:hypothetical protein
VCSSDLRIIKAENRLAKIIGQLGGVSSGELVRDADGKVQDLSGEIRAFVQENLTPLLGYVGKSEDVLFADSRKLGGYARNIAEVAGAAGMEGVGEIARGISSMIDNLSASWLWHSDALKLHLDSLALMNQGAALDRDAQALVLNRLQTMRQAVGVVE